MKLLGWELLHDSQVRLGGELRVRLYWQAEERITQSLHSFVHLTTPSPKRSWAVAQNDNPGWIPTNDWSPTLYVVDDLALNVPLELPPTTYTLAAGLVDENGQRLDVPNDRDGMVTLREIALAPLRTGKRQALHPSVVAPATFGTDLRLQGYDFLPAADGGRELNLYWAVLPSSSHTERSDLVTFVHVLDAENNLVAQFDGPPLEGLRPTSQWPPGALVVDRRTLRLPADLPSGSYTLMVGLYDPTSMARTAVVPEGDAGSIFSPDNALVIPFTLP